ncbi:MAG TPA: aminomethyl transferase family protein, partial [Planctomycetes bacterium]|nr:aminomethyl transferase family protein [Planctomycetota bacterium]
KQMSPRWKLVGLELSLPDIEKLYSSVGLPPVLPIEACRTSRPVHRRGRQVGYITSSTFSPILKSAIALATVEGSAGEPGTGLEVEFTIEHVHHRIPATVVERPFFDPPRKRS